MVISSGWIVWSVFRQPPPASYNNTNGSLSRTPIVEEALEKEGERVGEEEAAQARSRETIIDRR
jgi:hypothetical protein